MAVTQRRLGELQKEAKDFGITVKTVDGGFQVDLASGRSFTQPAKLRGNKLGKDQYVLALRLHNLYERYPNFPEGAPNHLKFILSLETPMLCIQAKHMPEEWHSSVWTDPKWVAEEKINGCRMVAIYSKNEGIHFYSRNMSVIDYLPVEYKNIWMRDFNPEKFADEVGSFILDCEVLCPVSKVDTTKHVLSSRGVVTETRLQATAALLAMNDEESLRIQRENDIEFEFYPFHVLELNGSLLMEMPYWQNRQIMDVMLPMAEGMGLNAFMVRRADGSDKKALYEAILSEGGEGVVLKNVDAPYIPTESRYHRMWVKMKRTASETLGDTIDGFVSGYLPGKQGTGFENLVGALIISVYLNKEDGTQEQKEIAHVPNLTLEQRKEMTELKHNGDEARPMLKQEYYGRVVEVDGQWFSARNKRLMHAKLVRFRTDKSPEQCTFEESTINSMIIGSEGNDLNLTVLGGVEEE